MRGTTNIPSVYVLLRQNGKLAFVRRQNTGFMDGKLCLPAGHVEGIESFSEAAVREAREETGVTITPDQLKHIYTMHRNQMEKVIRVDVFFEAISWEGVPKNNEPTLHSELVWRDVDNLPFDDIMDFQVAALKNITSGKSYGEFGWRP